MAKKVFTAVIILSVLFVCLYPRSFPVNLPQKYQDENGRTFLAELDCWHWARYTQNVVDLGHPGDKIINAKPIDALMLSPLGAEVIWPRLLFYLSAFLYQALGLFWPLPLFTFLFYLPLLFSAGLFLLLFLFCRRYWGNITAIIACLTVGLAPVLINRSSAGWFDTDILNLIFPLLTVWAYLLAQQARGARRAVAWLILSGLWLGLFSFTWLYWWFIYFIIMFYEVISCFLAPGEQFRQRAARVLAFSLFSAGWVFVFCRAEPFFALPRQFFSSLFLNDAGIGSVWPNTFTTVDELRKPGLGEIARLTGSEPLFFSGLASIVLLFLRRKNYGLFKQRAIALFACWFALMFFACGKGARFVIFLLIPLGVYFGWMMEELVSGAWAKRRLFSRLIVMLILLLSLTPLFFSALKAADKNLPMMNRTWYSVLQRMRDQTPAGSVINSWWDYGDWFTTVSRRPVIFDGHTQEYPQSYWMARVLLSDSEAEAIAILRMLNNAANRPFEIVNQYLRDPRRSLFILKQALSRPQEAGRILRQYLPLAAVKELEIMLLAKPKHKAYFVVDDSMPAKMPAISYLGNWPAGKGRNKSSAGVLKFYSGRISGEKFGCSVVFKDIMAYLPESREAKFFRPGGENRPVEFYLFENNRLVKKTGQRSGDSAGTALVYNENKDYYAILLSPPLAESLFVRLFYLNGAGLKYFAPFYQVNNSDNSIKIFEILWE